MKIKRLAIPIVLVFGCVAFLQKAQAVLPAPDGGYPAGNTAEGQSALLSLTTGGFNTAVGYLSLRSNTTNSFNTAIGAGTLLANTADQNTATGAGALLSNTLGLNNTANGTFALFSNTTGSFNTANGLSALFNNTTGRSNTANGDSALFSNTTGVDNTANGAAALQSNTTGSNNIALGTLAGQNVTSSNGVAVFVNSNGRLGTTTSSARFKDEIKPMDKASEAVLALKPVTFRYKKELDPACIPQFGLVAEEVEKVNPALVVRDEEGKPYSVRYDQVNAMLLNEFLKEHGKVEEQQAAIAELNLIVVRQVALITQQQKGLEAITARVAEQGAQLQKVLGLIQMSQGAPQVVSNTP